MTRQRASEYETESKIRATEGQSQREEAVEMGRNL
jgi:hypothetical protein